MSLPWYYFLTHLILKQTTVHLWATGGGVLSSASFVVIRDAATTFTSDCFENCLAKTFVAYLAQSRVSEVVNVKHMQFLRNSLADLFSVDVERCSKKAVLSVSQLAKVLRWGLQTKKKVIRDQVFFPFEICMIKKAHQ